MNEKLVYDNDKFDIQISAAMNFSSIFSAMTVFFTGLIIANYKNFGESIRIPALFLIVSALGFMFSTIIYANSSVLMNDNKKFRRAILTGDVISEYIGVYLFLAAIPMVINLVTGDNFLRFSVLLSIIIGLLFYHFSGFSFTGLKMKKLHMPFLFI